LFFGALFLTGTALAASEPKVDVCHLTGNGSYNLINVSANAVPAHLAHGDGYPGQGFTQDCTPLYAEQGAIAIETDQPSVRYRSFANTGGEEIYIGKHDLGDGANRAVLMITTMEPFRDRVNGATSGSG